MHGLRLRVLTNRTKVAEVRDVLELLGVELEELPGLSECPDPTVPERRVLHDREADGRTARRVLPHLAVHQPGQRPHPPRHHRPGDRRGPRRGRLPVRRPRHDRLDPRRGDVPARREPASCRRSASCPPGTTSSPASAPRPSCGRSACSSPTSTRRSCRSARPTRSTPTLELAGRHGVLAGPTSGATYWAARQYLRQQPVPAGAAAPRGHHRLRPAGALPVLFPRSAARTCSGRRGAPPRATCRTTSWRPRPSSRSATLAGMIARPGACCASTPAAAWRTGSATCPAR